MKRVLNILLLLCCLLAVQEDGGSIFGEALALKKKQQQKLKVPFAPCAFATIGGLTLTMLGFDPCARSQVGEAYNTYVHPTAGYYGFTRTHPDSAIGDTFKNMADRAIEQCENEGSLYANAWRNFKPQETLKAGWEGATKENIQGGLDSARESTTKVLELAKDTVWNTKKDEEKSEEEKNPRRTRVDYPSCVVRTVRGSPSGLGLSMHHSEDCGLKIYGDYLKSYGEEAANAARRFLAAQTNNPSWVNEGQLDSCFGQQQKCGDRMNEYYYNCGSFPFGPQANFSNFEKFPLTDHAYLQKYTNFQLQNLGVLDNKTAKSEEIAEFFLELAGANISGLIVSKEYPYLEKGSFVRQYVLPYMQCALELGENETKVFLVAHPARRLKAYEEMKSNPYKYNGEETITEDVVEKEKNICQAEEDICLAGTADKKNETGDANIVNKAGQAVFNMQDAVTEVLQPIQEKISSTLDSAKKFADYEIDGPQFELTAYAISKKNGVQQVNRRCLSDKEGCKITNKIKKFDREVLNGHLRAYASGVLVLLFGAYCNRGKSNNSNVVMDRQRQAQQDNEDSVPSPKGSKPGDEDAENKRARLRSQEFVGNWCEGSTANDEAVVQEATTGEISLHNQPPVNKTIVTDAGGPQLKPRTSLWPFGSLSSLSSSDKEETDNVVVNNEQAASSSSAQPPVQTLLPPTRTRVDRDGTDEQVDKLVEAAGALETLPQDDEDNEGGEGGTQLSTDFCEEDENYTTSLPDENTTSLPDACMTADEDTTPPENKEVEPKEQYKAVVAQLKQVNDAVTEGKSTMELLSMMQSQE